MKTIIAFLLLCSTASAQTYGLAEPVQPVVVVQQQQRTFGLGVFRPRPVVRYVPTVQAEPTPAVVSAPVAAPVVYQPVIVSQPAYQPRWQLVRQQVCDGQTCRIVYRRVWR